ncbi:MAG: permease [Rhodospirillales bacterium]|nr:permease [Rhodospirillales bacterium]
MSSCDMHPPPPQGAPTSGRFSFDPVFHGSLGALATGLIVWGLGALLGAPLPFVGVFAAAFSYSALSLFGQMWWGLALAFVVVGVMHRMPREYVAAMLGRGDTFGGIVRATLAGLVLDLCSHGILMVAAKLYERGASLAQIMAFLIASPWNSFSLTLVLVALIGLKWTLLYVVFSAAIALSTGWMVARLVRDNKLPHRTYTVDLPEGYRIWPDLKARLCSFRPTFGFFGAVLKDGWREGQMVLRWIVFGAVLASLIRAGMPDTMFAHWFGPTLAGLALTLLAATVIEVCSEGSAPIAADLLTRAGAPGNGFAFLMAGVATDYTEIMVLRQLTHSWKAAFILPLLSVPQTLVIGYLMNG